MAFLQSNIPHFKCWVRKEYTHNHQKYHGEFIHAMAIAVTSMPAKYYFTVDYTDSEIADDPAQHKQSHVMELLDAGKWTGNIVALPNNRVRVTHPAWFETGEGAPDFRPSQHIHYSKSDLDYTLDVNKVFDNLYAEDLDEEE
jgi:hypothetical protein